MKRPLGQMGSMFFLKKAWHIIREDIYALCFDFYNHNANLKSINSSFIILVLKKIILKNIDDFRPITLLNTSRKITTKLLANRLERVILDIIHTIWFHDRKNHIRLLGLGF